MGIRQRVFTAMAGVLALAACAQPSGGPMVDLAAEEQAIRGASMDWLAASVTARVLTASA